MLRALTLLFLAGFVMAQPARNAIGIHIKQNDDFSININDPNSNLNTTLQGYFDNNGSKVTGAILGDAPATRSTSTTVWSEFIAITNRGDTLLRSALEQLRAVLEIDYFEACVIATPAEVSAPRRKLISFLLEETFGCKSGAYATSEMHAVISAIGFQAFEFEDSLLAVVTQDGTTHLYEGDYGTMIAMEVVPNLDQALLKQNIGAIVFIQDDETNKPLGNAYRPNNPVVHYAPTSAITRGAGIQAASMVMQEPVEILPLAIGIVLHGAISHILIPQHSTLPSQVAINVTTAHNNQQFAQIELRAGSRPRKADTLALTMLTLDGITPAPAGAARIEVLVTVDKYLRGIVVEARERGSGAYAKQMVGPNFKIFQAGVLEKCVEEQEANREDDAKLRDQAHEWAHASPAEPSEGFVAMFRENRSHNEL